MTLMVKVMLSLLLTVPIMADSQPPIDKNALLGELDKLETQGKNQTNGSLQAIITEVSTASASPKEAIALYERAIFATKFEGEKLDEVEFRKWKDKEAETVKDPEFMAAVQFQFEYLTCVLRHVAGQDSSLIVNDLIGFVRRYRQQNGAKSGDSASANTGATSAGADGGGVARKKNGTNGGAPQDLQLYRSVLDQSLVESAIAKYYHVDKRLSAAADWELKTSQIDGIESKDIFPTLRTMKDKVLLDLWDEKIAYSQSVAAAATLADEKLLFDAETYPQMLWDRSKDQVLLGDQSQGIASLMGLLRTNQLHPNYKTWMSEMRTILAGSETSNVATKVPTPK